MKIIDLPQHVLRTTKLTWTMEMNHGYLASGFSGVGQVQRGQMERWKVAFSFLNLSNNNSYAAEEFFLQLEGNANLFRFHDPSRPRPRGQVWKDIWFKNDYNAGSRELELSNLPPNLYQAFLPGDWLQIGNQLTKVCNIVSSDDSGCAKVKIWPKLWQKHLAYTPVIYEQAKGLFRFLSDSPEWEISAGTTRPYSFKLTGMQEVIPLGHPLSIGIDDA